MLVDAVRALRTGPRIVLEHPGLLLRTVLAVCGLDTLPHLVIEPAATEVVA